MDERLTIVSSVSTNLWGRDSASFRQVGACEIREFVHVVTLANLLHPRVVKSFRKPGEKCRLRLP